MAYEHANVHESHSSSQSTCTSESSQQHADSPLAHDSAAHSSPAHGSADRFHHSLAQIQHHAATMLSRTNGADDTYPSRARVLSVEGSDPIGGAGTMADMKAFTAHGVFGYAAMTCVCAQNTQGVTDIVNMEPDFLREQLISVSSDGIIDSMKIGMLGTPEIVDCVRDWLVDLLHDYERRGLPRPWIVIDPVMYAKSGDSLLTPEAEQELRSILPLADIITPNVPELAALAHAGAHTAAGIGAADTASAPDTASTPTMPRTWDEAVNMACVVAQDLGVRVYAKAGMFALQASENHAADKQLANSESNTTDACEAESALQCNDACGVEPAMQCNDACGAEPTMQCNDARGVEPVMQCNDVLVEPAALCSESGSSAQAGSPRITTLYGPRVETVNVHGTGDSLSSSLAALRPRFLDWRETAQAAKDWMVGAISGANDLHVGKGHGPIDFTWESAPTSRLFTDEYWGILSQAAAQHRDGAHNPTATQSQQESASHDATAHNATSTLASRYPAEYLEAYVHALIAAASEASDASDRAFFIHCASNVSAQIPAAATGYRHCAYDGDVTHTGSEHDGKRRGECSGECRGKCSGKCSTVSDALRAIADQHSLGLLAAALLPHFWIASLEYGPTLADSEADELSDITAHIAQIANREARLASHRDYQRMIDTARELTRLEYSML
ncbi:bifunctional hydroxymethylpyrimidine kinase/phosphomethylpyrimidine kinase [Pseudoscardovia suis]|uniref:Multifunctional hydroxymethylpyrimidine phosphokinase/4-amino-5-aminomethyl-2-methylpyrimidine hydrolase n=1 Tax=Pseudoscardovia suis TaxID=987063 RepID=A0A261EXN4_9BIFI|nr:bifunctional hydroxymethylpyrimidine kinase/phosphomethylpyrimidine kinase [Pseudoscardovia suis]OZG51426.1 multifunctional hydroxymethylpyrimidine phosphokinase/4-amino-5-aminomethyl-2-methylpyrimidine hydrolase [Pseudoscardovia suis]PJJ68691.1 hydroxymethylpyrimidine kinase/phosphomethylpyrimidine kinase [Pseudoscardovia suis]